MFKRTALKQLNKNLKKINNVQVEHIQKKLKEAPDESYQIGVIIGTFLPFVVMVIIAYLLFYYFKKRNDASN